MVIIKNKIHYWNFQEKVVTSNCYYYLLYYSLKIFSRSNIRENETYNILQNFGMQTDHLIPARRPDLVMINKKKKKKKKENLAGQSTLPTRRTSEWQ